jgi:hypothetical protein
MNKHFFLYLISMALITSCADLVETPGSRTASATTPGTATASVPTPGTATASVPTPGTATASVPTPETATASVPTPETATTSVVAPPRENYGLYTDSDLRIYADTIDARIQQALKNNDSNQAQALGLKRQELIAEFNRRGLKRYSVAAPTPRTHHSHRVNRRGSTDSHARTKVNPPAAGLPGEN